jgi:hypothetical protein
VNTTQVKVYGQNTPYQYHNRKPKKKKQGVDDVPLNSSRDPKVIPRTKQTKKKKVGHIP